MIIIMLFILGLCFGSFVNALIWRLHEQQKTQHQKSKAKKTPHTTNLKSETDLSILKGRSMCPHCQRTLKAVDLLPVVSWIALGGKCRYCGKAISWQYPVVELMTAVLFILSYLMWPHGFHMAGMAGFIIWLAALVGFMALIVYDFRWMLLPNRIVYPLIILAATGVILQALLEADFRIIIDAALSLAIAGGIFYVLFQISDGKWIGGGDVKLGFALGLLLGRPDSSFLMLFIASLIGTLVVVPGMVSGRVSRTSRLPFGPFLIVATIIVQLFGRNLIEWYKNQLLH